MNSAAIRTLRLVTEDRECSKCRRTVAHSVTHGFDDGVPHVWMHALIHDCRTDEQRASDDPVSRVAIRRRLFPRHPR